jgi:hypothetical protein
MKLRLLFILFLVTTIKASAQTIADTLITSFVNAVHTEVVKPDMKFYYLDEKGINPRFDKYDLSELRNDKEILDEIPLEEFVSVIALDTSSINWKNYALDRAKCVKKRINNYTHSYRIINILSYNSPDSVITQKRSKGIIPVLIKKGMSKKRIQAETAKAIQKYDQSFSAEDKAYYTFSKPIFSKNRDFALISLNGSGTGCIYIFKLVDGKWIKKFVYKCWVS